MDLTKPAKALPVECAYCGATVPQKPGAGRVRRFCTPHHGAAYRHRLRVLGWA
ncbi:MULTISPECIES: hypothetical protein [Streptomyces]|uniref:Uncharacterized protein n=1 Tax=Streptomyces fradiae ATCC 10745 = DSM 40063 TaxID=1319510 RepID=A0A1Y2NTF7_STRFR|nr:MULTISPECIES: hypothetical protein [Streptomyces]KAF0651729.1 hypothetical protein K701_01985 [Streptomyces fradiae ATCC 10745 = DSM 40063]OSY50785.1 hypothetical protein BG846_03583 [Streptomyces fradiae ATCC 10745 = DSM 40063]